MLLRNPLVQIVSVGWGVRPRLEGPCFCLFWATILPILIDIFTHMKLFEEIFLANFAFGGLVCLLLNRRSPAHGAPRWFTF